MAGMKFEYDENGAKFVYFALSFYVMVIIPITYYLWPSKEAKKSSHPEDLSCYEPARVKTQKLNQDEPKKQTLKKAIKAAIIIGWIVFFFLAYQTSKIEIEHKEYDPFVILNIDRESTDKEIRKAYRELSKTMHPDKGGDEEKFKELTTAYKALTDEEAKNNWREYGNPDGPGATQFGIALPKWIVEGKNSYIVLGAYVLVFMVLMPTFVGIWWYKSIKYTGDQVLIRTYQLYYYLFAKSPLMNTKRIIMILGSSFEFERHSNPEVTERPSDNVEVPQLIKDLPELQDKIKEAPFSYPYSLKARALLHAHLTRIELPADSLDKDRNLIVKKSPFLINEMINIIGNITNACNSNYAPRGVHPPRLETLESVMRLSPMIVQALWNKNKKSDLLQLPHLNESHLRHFVTKKRNIATIKQFVAMSDLDRRSVLRHLNDEQYDDVMRICSCYPLVQMDAKVKIIDDEDEQTITVGALVTLVVNLKRRNLSVLFDKEDLYLKNKHMDFSDEMPEGGGDAPSNADDENSANVAADELNKPTPAAQKAPAKKTDKNAKAKTKAQKAKAAAKNKVKLPSIKEAEKVETLGADNDDDDNNNNNNNSDNENESDKEEGKQTAGEANTSKTGAQNDNDEYFEKFQEIQKKKESLETKSKISHRVFCPFFPEIKQECWWLYVCDRKQNSLISTPIYICTLKDSEEYEIKFLAPATPGSYTYSVILRSDSYFDFDLIQFIKFDVKEAEKIDNHPQWDFSDDEEANKNGEEEDNEYNTESEEDDE